MTMPGFNLDPSSQKLRPNLSRQKLSRQIGAQIGNQTDAETCAMRTVRGGSCTVRVYMHSYGTDTRSSFLANAVPPGIYRGKYAIFDLSVNVWESGEKDW